MKFFPLILKDQRRNRRRSSLTVLSIAASLFIFCTVATGLLGEWLTARLAVAEALRES
jgi:hypothetical protein